MAELTHPEARIRAVRQGLASRERTVTLGLALAATAVFALSLCLGDYPVPLPDIVRSLFSPLTGQTDPSVDFIIWSLRLPRAITGLLAGIGFGLSGIMFQTLVRNPLASPDIIGISTGASAGAVVVIMLFAGGGAMISAGALVGALGTATAIYLLAWRRGVSAYRMVLIGIGMAAILSAVISFFFTRARLQTVQKALVWLTGSLNGASFEQVLPLAVALLVLVPAALLLSRPLASLQLGDDASYALGNRVELSRVGLIVVAVALAAFPTAAVGPLAFVAFVSGPIARSLLGQAGSGFVPAALAGAIVTMGSDILAQHFMSNSQLPAGVVTGGFGAVFLIWLLVVSNRSGRGG